MFRTVIRRSAVGLPNLVKTNAQNHGIPQGSQISALLSNVYMLPFDSEMTCLAAAVDGYYRRYSDDILWICRLEDAACVRQELNRSLDKLGGAIKIKEEKTECSIFCRNAGGRLECDRPIQYLGFIFDGSNARIRSQTLSKFWRRVIYAVRTARRAASRSIAAPRIVYKRKIYRLFTHLGRRNLITYAKRSEAVMGTGAIRAQMRRHVPRIAKELGVQSAGRGQQKARP